MNQTKLRQLQNNVEIVGTLKSKELEVETSKNGKNFMSGRMVVQSMVNNKMNEHVIEIFTMQSSKLFKGLETVKDDYQTIDADGLGNADRIIVRGTLKLKEYSSNQENLIQYNEVRGMIFNRLDKSDNQADKAIASIETVVDGFVAKINEDQSPTGEFLLNGFTVGWGNDVIELKGAFVASELAQAFMNLYQPGSTGRLSFSLSSFAEVEEREEVVAQAGFGTSVAIEDTFKPRTRYTSGIEIIGGDLPFFGTTEYTEEEIKNAKKVRTLKLLEIENKNNAPIGQKNTGFGQVAPVQILSTGINSNDGMPDF